LCIGEHPVPLFERPKIEASGKEEANCIVDELTLSVGITPKEGNLSTLFNPTEEEFWEVGHGVWAAEHVIIAFQCGWCGFAIIAQ
jgi:hypothetical protein